MIISETEKEELPLATMQDLEEANGSAVPQVLGSAYPTDSSQLSSPILPLPSASANEVRDYIRGLLIVKHNTTREYAEDVAVKWRLQRGWHLRGMSAKRFTALFGDEIGPLLHRDVVKEREAQVRAEELSRFEVWQNSDESRDYRCKSALVSSLLRVTRLNLFIDTTILSLIASAIMFIVRLKRTFRPFPITLFYKTWH